MADALARLAGPLHNFGLDAVAAFPNFKEASAETLYQRIKDFFTERAQELGVSADFIPYPQAQEFYNEYIGDTKPDTALSRMLEQGKISDTQFKLATIAMTRTCDVIYKANDGTMVPLLQDDLRGLMDYAEQTNLPENEQEGIVGLASVLVHSNEYWVNAFLNDKNPWHGLDDNPPVNLRFNWMDAAGFLLGWGTGGILIGIALGTFFSSLMTQDPPKQ